MLNQFPEVFTGLGNLGREYQIQLKQDIQPFALLTPIGNVLKTFSEMAVTAALASSLNSVGVVFRVTLIFHVVSCFVVITSKNN